MFPVLSRRARLFAALIALIALASLVIRFLITLEEHGGDPVAALWDLARFFTILTNLLVVTTFGLAAIRRNGFAQAWTAALTLAMILVGGVYHALLSHLTDFSGWALVADHGFHTVVPIACLIWWLAYAPKRDLVYADLPTFVVWPVVYVAYALWRGAYTADYPYPFMDLVERSQPVVATNLAGLTLVMLLGGVIFISIGRYADR
jgi:hypothetical protein